MLQVNNQKPMHMLKLPCPGIVPLPSLLNSHLHDSSLPYVAVPVGFGANEDTAQKQRHVEGPLHSRPPM